MAHGIILQTQADAPAGLLSEWAARRGIGLDTVRVDEHGAFPDPRDPDFVVALGSGATAAGGGPDWVEAEIEWLRAADAAALPVLGICFGAQALAAALGGCVHKLAKPELGWITVDTLDAATRRHAAAAARSADRLFDGFAARAGLVAVASRV